MRRLLLIFACLSACACLAQTNRFPPINLYAGDPTGNACTGNLIQQSSTTGLLYTCRSGVMGIGGTTGNLTPSPQFSLFYQPNSGTAAAAVGDPNITTDGAGNMHAGTVAVVDAVTSSQNFGLVYQVNSFKAGTWQGTWAIGTTYPACSAVLSGGTTYISGAVSTGLTPGGADGVWFPSYFTGTYTPTNLECAAASLLYLSMANSQDYMLHVNTGTYTTGASIVLRDPNKSSRYNVLLSGDGRYATVINLGNRTSKPVFYVPKVAGDFSTATVRRIVISGMYINGNNNTGGQPALDVEAANFHAQYHDLYIRSNYTGTSLGVADWRLGTDGDADTQTYEASVLDVTVAAFLGDQTGVLDCTLNGSGTPTCSVTSGGTTYDWNTLPVALGAAGKGAAGSNPCGTPGTWTATGTWNFGAQTVGSVTGVTTTATGCYGSVTAAHTVVTLGTGPVNATYTIAASSGLAKLQVVVAGGVITSKTITAQDTYAPGAAPTFTPPAGLGTGATIAVTLVLPVWLQSGENMQYGMFFDNTTDNSQFAGLTVYTGLSCGIQISHSQNSVFSTHIDNFGQYGICSTQNNRFYGVNAGEAYQSQIYMSASTEVYGLTYGSSIKYPFQSVVTLNGAAIGSGTAPGAKIYGLNCNNLDTTAIEFHTVSWPAGTMDAPGGVGNLFRADGLDYCGPFGSWGAWGGGINNFASPLVINGALYAQGSYNVANDLTSGFDVNLGTGAVADTSHTINFNARGNIGYSKFSSVNGMVYQATSGLHRFYKAGTMSLGVWSGFTEEGGFCSDASFNVGGACGSAPFSILADGTLSTTKAATVKNLTTTDAFTPVQVYSNAWTGQTATLGPITAVASAPALGATYTICGGIHVSGSGSGTVTLTFAATSFDGQVIAASSMGAISLASAGYSNINCVAPRLANASALTLTWTVSGSGTFAPQVTVVRTN